MSARIDDARVQAVRNRAYGKWPNVLQSLGLTEHQVTNRHQPCPACGGTDRYRMDDKHGDGGYYCNGCGAGDGISLLMKVNGWRFNEAITALEAHFGLSTETLPETPPRTPQKPAQRTQEPVKASALARLIADAVPLTDPRAKPVLDYLENRLGTLPAELPRLGCIPSCAYYEDGKRIADYPAMLALVRDASGTVVQAQRTYVHDGRKAPVSAPKKYMAGAFPKGAAVRLYHCTGPLARLIVGEGIETTLALRHKLGGNAPAWAMLTAGNLQSAEIPFDVAELDVAVDRDDLVSASYAGPRASYELRQRMKAFYTRTRLHAPPRGTKDWADVARASNGR